MNLSTLLGFQNQNTNKIRTGSTNGSESSSHATGNHSGDIRNFVPGQTVQGEVVSVKGNEVTIALNKDTLLNAKLDKDIQVSQGQTLTFEVKSNSGARIALSPLYENMGQNPNILKALTAAGLPPTVKNISMVSILMEEGMPVDKNNLQSFNRQIAMNESANPVTLAQMNRLQIPVTPENIAQFEAYKNYEHQISQSILEIADGLDHTFSQMMKAGDTEGAVNLYKNLLNVFTGEGSIKAEQPAGGSTTVILPEEIAVSEGETQETKLQDQTAVKLQAAIQEQTAVKEQAVLQEQGKAAENKQPAVLTDLSQLLLDETGEQNTKQISSQPQDLNALLSMDPKSREQLANLLKDAGFPEQLAAKVLAGDITQTALLQELSKALKAQPEAFETAKLADLFGSKEYNHLLKNEIARQWLLAPEEVSGDRQVKELYNRLSEQTQKLANALSQSAKADTPLANTVNNLSQNVNFVNQLNQMFTYVQLPLKMNGENTHGELYVYTNKKNLAKQDGNVSALLHLDMKNLGPVDVYVAMQNQNVSTKFYLKDDSTIDFIADHIHILSERLEKKGYSMKSEFVYKEKAKSAVEEMFEANKNVSILSSLSFDARA